MVTKSAPGGVFAGGPRSEPLKWHHLMKLFTFLAHLADFGRHFGAQRISEASPKSSFLHKILKNMKKWRHRNDTEKNVKF